MGFEQRQLLAAVDGVGGIVDVEDNARRHDLEAAAKQVDQRQPHAPQRAPRRRVLQPRQGWLAHQVIAAFRQPPAGQLKGRVDAQGIKIVAILIAAGDGEHPRPDHVGVAVSRTPRIAFVLNARCQQLGQAEAALDLAQQQNAAIRRQPPAVKPGAQFLARDG